MINLALTLLPIAMTFSVAAWHSPSKELQPTSRNATCRNCLS
jgi:hypothetical protein